MKFFFLLLLIIYSYQYIPKGCTCLNGNQNLQDCTDYDCRCTCDLTNVCDTNCCCDEDCSEDERQNAYELGQCVFSGAETSRVKMCRNNDYFQKVNSYTNMRFDNLLCVEVDNNPSKGNFYIEPDSTISFPSITPEPSSISSNLINEFYVVNSDIYVSVNETENEANEINERELQTITTNNKQPLIFLAPGFSNLCLKTNRAKFMSSPIRTTNCLYEIKQSEILTEGLLDPLYYTNMQYYITPNGTAKDPIVSYNGGDLDIIGNTVNNVVSNVNYVIKYTYDTASNNQSKKIINEFDITITTTNIANIQYPYYHPITSTIQYVDITTNNNNIVMQRSGNPGYLKGYPIICANGTTSSCINNHLSIPTPSSNGRCDFTTGFSSLNFGSGYISYCYITSADLANINNAISWFNGVAIGKYGNSDYNTTIPDEWINMEVSSNCPAAASTSPVSVITFHFVTSYIGAFPNAQEIIIKAQVSCENANYNANGFYLKVAAVFDRADIKKFKDYTPPKPKLKLKLPADIFRPFLMKDVED